MPWVRGTVEVGDDESVTGSGQALALYIEISTAEQAVAPLPDPDEVPEDWTQSAEAWAVVANNGRLQAKRAWARQANMFASIAEYAGANGVSS